MNSTLSPLTLSIAQRSAPKPYCEGNAPSSTGSAGVPPRSHSALECAASDACSGVSSIVTAPSSVSPVGCPATSSSGIRSLVTMPVGNGLVTRDSAPHVPVTALVW